MGVYSTQLNLHFHKNTPSRKMNALHNHIKASYYKKKLNAWIQEWLNQVYLKLTILEKKIKSETLKTVPGMTAIEKCWSEKHTYIISSIFVTNIF